jgi:hypothetical protein
MPIPNEQAAPKPAPAADAGDWTPWTFCPKCLVNAGWYVAMRGIDDMRQTCKCCGFTGRNFHFAAQETGQGDAQEGGEVKG